MSKVKSISRGMININDHVDKRSFDIDVEELSKLCPMGSRTITPDKKKDFLYLSNIELQVRTLFNIKDEVTDPTVKIFVPPRERNSDIISIEPSGQLTGARVLINAGSSREIYTFSATGGGISGEGKLLLPPGEGIFLKFGFSGAMTVMCNNTTNDTLPPRSGFRSTVVKKDPTKRWIIVLDFPLEMKKFAEVIRKEALEATGGDETKAEKIIEKFGVKKE